MLFCLTASYTPQALKAMRENPTTNRREAVEQLVTAAGGKLISMYGTIAEGPGALVIFDADPVAAAAITGVAASSDGVQNVRMMRLLAQEDVVAIRQKAKQIQGSYKTPGK
jgi:uncharacterized protein with GYD domain